VVSNILGLVNAESYPVSYPVTHSLKVCSCLGRGCRPHRDGGGSPWRVISTLPAVRSAMDKVLCGSVPQRVGVGLVGGCWIREDGVGLAGGVLLGGHI